jgi:hypothetical protein
VFVKYVKYKEKIRLWLANVAIPPRTLLQKRISLSVKGSLESQARMEKDPLLDLMVRRDRSRVNSKNLESMGKGQGKGAPNIPLMIVPVVPIAQSDLKDPQKEDPGTNPIAPVVPIAQSDLRDPQKEDPDTNPIAPVVPIVQSDLKDPQKEDPDTNPIAPVVPTIVQSDLKDPQKEDPDTNPIVLVAPIVQSDLKDPQKEDPDTNPIVLVAPIAQSDLKDPQKEGLVLIDRSALRNLKGDLNINPIVPAVLTVQSSLKNLVLIRKAASGIESQENARLLNLNPVT